MRFSAGNVQRALYKLCEVLLRVRWISTSVQDTVITLDNDKKRCAYAYTLFAALLIDLRLLDPLPACKYVYKLAHCDIAEVARIMKEYDSLLIHHWTNDEHVLTYDEFQAHQTLGKWFIRPYVSHILRIIRSSEKQSFKTMHQAMSFLSRLSLDGTDPTEFILEFVNRNRSPKPVDMDLAKRLQPILAKMLDGVDFEPWGRHGTGATADAGRVSAIEKSLFLGFDTFHKYAFHREGWDVRDFVPFGWEFEPSSIRYAKVQSVPKSALKRRIIALETVTMQWFQQLVRSALYRHIQKRLPSIPIVKQEVNRERAYAGSIGGHYTTIDLSAASDSVSWLLVKTAFAKSGIMHWLYAARTWRIQYAIKDPVTGISSTHEEPLNMFATMGSAICFPIECLIFDAICRLATQDANMHWYDCTVYGDDIVCPTELSKTIQDYLTRLGFSVNLDKTFDNPHPETFRESCGGEYLGGVDVTPLRIPRNFSSVDPLGRPTSVDCWIDLANLCLGYNYFNTRKFIVRHLLDYRVTKTIKHADGTRSIFELDCPLVVFGFQDHLVHTSNATWMTNYHLTQRWNSDFQRLEFWGTRTVAVAAPTVWFHKLFDCKLKHIRKPTLTQWLKHDLRRAEEDIGIIPYRTYPATLHELVNHLQYFLWFSQHHNNDIPDNEQAITFGSKVEAGYLSRCEACWIADF